MEASASEQQENILKCNIRRGNKKFNRNTLKAKSEFSTGNKKSKMNTLKAKVNEIFHTKIDASLSSGVKYEYAEPKNCDSYVKCWREEGINLFRRGRYCESVHMYTRSISLASADSTDLILAYSERSASFFRLGNYEACLLDANRAIKAGCSEGMKKMLRKRKKDCLIERQKGEVEVDHIRSDATDPADLKGAQYARHERIFVNENIFTSVNPLLPNTTSKVDFVFDAEKGGIMVASKDLEAGEFISVEEFCVVRLDESKLFYNCAYCFIRCDCLIPCPSCSWEMYCCENCRSEAWSQYHRIECQIIEFYAREGNDWRDIIALRSFLIATKQGLELDELLKKIRLDEIFDEIPCCPSLPFVQNYSSSFDIMRLSRMFDNEKYLEDIEEVLPLAVDTIIALRSVSFFKNSSPKCLNEQELFSAILLAKNYILLGWGSFEIFAQTWRDSLDEHNIGLAVNILQSFYTYSCNPNTHSFVEDRHRIVYATRPIKAGEQLFFADRHSFMYYPSRKMREQTFTDGYTCDCEACSNDWPSPTELMSSEIQFLDDTARDGVIESTRSLLKKYESSENLRDGDVMLLLIELINSLSSSLKKPSYDLFSCEELLRRFQNAFFSDFHFSKNDSLKKEFQRIVNKIMERLKKRSPLEI